eukprot:484601-Amphidinium_carterae.1
MSEGHLFKESTAPLTADIAGKAKQKADTELLSNKFNRKPQDLGTTIALRVGHSFTIAPQEEI